MDTKEIIKNGIAVLKRWSDLGFMEGIEDFYTCVRLAGAFERMAKHLLQIEKEGKEDSRLNTIVFPMLRRLIEKNGVVLPAEFVYNYSVEHYDELLEKNSDEKDPEAAATAELVDVIAKVGVGMDFHSSNSIESFLNK